MSTWPYICITHPPYITNPPYHKSLWPEEHQTPTLAALSHLPVHLSLSQHHPTHTSTHPYCSHQTDLHHLFQYFISKTSYPLTFITRILSLAPFTHTATPKTLFHLTILHSLSLHRVTHQPTNLSTYQPTLTTLSHFIINDSASRHRPTHPSRVQSLTIYNSITSLHMTSIRVTSL
jgi:hypothetical protein